MMVVKHLNQSSQHYQYDMYDFLENNKIIKIRSCVMSDMDTRKMVSLSDMSNGLISSYLKEKVFSM